MKKSILFGFALIFMFSLSSCDPEPTSSEVNIIPRPNRFFMGDTYFKIKDDTKVVLQIEDEEIRKLGDFLASTLRKITGFEIPIVLYDEAREVNGDILLNLSRSLNKNDEAYHLEYRSTNYILQANGGKGLFYAMQSFLQLIPPEVLVAENMGQFKIPGLNLSDAPRFAYRGMMLDVSRHFFPKEFILKFIDLMATYKFNTFHWHLTDDNGWRIEIKKYPLLTEVSAWRVDREEFHWLEREAPKPGEEATYGGFYTQEEVKEIIKYAQDRYITIIPEIEMPGHVSEVFAAYPELSCTGKEMTVNPGAYWPITDIFCAGKEETFDFIENVLDEVIALFPSEYIHIGGDEATKTEWEKCKLCQARMKKEGLKNEHELQSYFIKRVEAYVLSKGKQIIGWDEILEGGLAPEATVMSWRGMEGGIEAAEQGHDVIMTPTSHCYFDYYQADREFEPVAIGGFTTLKKVYSFEPIPPELSDEEAKHILGAQGNVWTEYIASPEHAEYMAIPRMIALAEVLWSSKNKRNYKHFNRRLQTHFKRFDLQNINYSKGSFKVDILPEQDSISGVTKVKLESEIWEAQIYYTLDGTLPDTSAILYKEPFEAKENVVIKAAVNVDGKIKEKPNELKIDE
jgi:hexosaminidase